ncbi:hypothetical protein BSLA_02f2773 [Burkholderia stabilis]|nr:hypothetical protein BSLA_02f2773 [Burkholderia stabilis]
MKIRRSALRMRGTPFATRHAPRIEPHIAAASHFRCRTICAAQ